MPMPSVVYDHCDISGDMDSLGIQRWCARRPAKDAMGEETARIHLSMQLARRRSLEISALYLDIYDVVTLSYKTDTT